MSHSDTTNSIQITPSGRFFDCHGQQSLLEAGLSAGLALPFNCSNGSCGTCKALVTEGAVKQVQFHDYVLSASDKQQNICLMCSYTALSDLSLEVIEADSPDDIPVQTLDAKLQTDELLSGVHVLRFKFKRGNVMRFFPGQSAMLTLPSGRQAVLPISSCPCDATYVEFHVSHQLRLAAISSIKKNKSNDDNSMVSELFVDELLSLKRLAQIKVSGPYGKLHFARDLKAPQLFLVSGIEFARVQGLLEHVFNIELEQNSCLIWAQDGTELYRYNQCRAWHDAIDNFCFIPVEHNALLSNEIDASWLNAFNQATVYVADTSNQLLPDLNQLGFSPAKTVQLLDRTSGSLIE
jgi:CDP-4-dehydro-6-deoxyglucose reductase